MQLRVLVRDRPNLIDACQAAVQRELLAGEVPAEVIDALVHEWWHSAVSVSGKPVQQALAGMYDEVITFRDPCHKILGELVRVKVVHPKSALHCYWNTDLPLNRSDHLANQVWPEHEACPEFIFAHKLAWAAYVEVDLIVAPPLTQHCAARHGFHVVAPELKNDRVFHVVEAVPALKALVLVVDNSRVNDHLGVEHSAWG
mmetsp:Transcript_10132/g.32209  ORF Transcript_10132/g.32209 Transcript_10132/m.32209 type:complete len:200 (+) Transcript_10132:102-701(+)